MDSPTFFFNSYQTGFEPFWYAQQQWNKFSYEDLIQYWWCEELVNYFNNSNSTEVHEESSSKLTPKENKRSNKLVFKPMIIDKADEILNKLEDLSDKDSIMFKRTSKTSPPPGHQPVKQRSKFIGVSKNGNHWQSLIVINNTKVYMGTYKTQKEAATVFDFHSMIVHFKWAKVNFDYSANDLIKMIQNFKQNSNEFEAKEYFKTNKC